MNVFVIPSWYPSEQYPSTGIFFREQSRLLATHRPNWNVGISLWGSHEPKLWLKAYAPLGGFIKYNSKPPIRKYENQLEYNCVEFFTPAFTWTRKFRNGNIRGIIAANRQNFERFTTHFGRPDVIHAHVSYPAGAIARALSEAYQVPYVITEHMSPFPMASFKKDIQKTVLPPLRAAGQVLAVSQALIKRLSEFGVRADRISNFLDDRFFTPGSAQTGRFTLVAVGRLEAQKNYEALLESIAHVQKAGVDFVLKVIGTGSREKHLRNQCSQLHLDGNVEWMGECNQNEVRQALRSANLVVNTSRHENQPVAILEAMACGVPVLTFDWDGADELVFGDAGEVLPPDPILLAEKVKTFVQKNPYDPQKVRATFEDHFGTAAQVQRLEQYYQRLLE